MNKIDRSLSFERGEGLLPVFAASLFSPSTGKKKQNGRERTYLVDPASSYMLVSKIKPCKCQYKLYNGETANCSLTQLLFI